VTDLVEIGWGDVDWIDQTQDRDMWRVLVEIEWGGVDWIDVAQDRDKWRALVDVVMNFWVHKVLGIYGVATQLVAFRAVLSSI
jgi:hypothetical protein